jgi:hypothetical protein
VTPQRLRTLVPAYLVPRAFALRLLDAAIAGSDCLLLRSMDHFSGAKAQREGVVNTRERLGGLLKYYHRRAAGWGEGRGGLGLDDGTARIQSP